MESLVRRLHLGFAASGILSLVLYPGAWVVGALQLAGASADLWRPYSRLLPYLPAGLAAAYGHAWSALAFAAVAAIAEALDPDARWRAQSAVAAVAVAAIAAFGLQQPADGGAAPAAGLAVVAILLTGWRGIAAATSTPAVYALPFVASGLALDGAPGALAWLPLSGAALALLAEGLRARGIRRLQQRPGG